MIAILPSQCSAGALIDTPSGGPLPFSGDVDGPDSGELRGSLPETPLIVQNTTHTLSPEPRRGESLDARHDCVSRKTARLVVKPRAHPTSRSILGVGPCSLKAACACGVDLLQPYSGDSEPIIFFNLTNCSTLGTISAGTRGPLISSG
jgi:hypothetical protein